MIVRRLLAVGLPLAAIALGAAPGPASAATTVAASPVGSATSPVFADGSRIAWAGVDGDARVVRVGSAHRVVVAAPRCDPDRSAATLSAFGAGRLLWTCHPGTPDGYPLVTRTDESTVLPVGQASRPGFDAAAEPLNVSFQGIGRRWLAGTELGSGGRTTSIFVRTGDGTVRRGQPASRRMTVDLDAPGLAVPLCRPVQRVGVADPLVPRAILDTPFLDVRPFGLDVRNGSEPLVLQRCGRRATRRLSRCDPGCRSVTLTRGAVAWIEADRVVVDRTTHADRTLIRLADAGSAGAQARSVALAGDRVYVTSDGPSTAAQGELWMARLPP
jgi:hypothetical protein